MDLADELGYYKVMTPHDIGELGENITLSALRSRIRDAIIVDNIYIPLEDKFTQIDMVLICKQGMYVIENKNYHCKIFGNANHEYLYTKYGFYESKLYNPVYQNRIHCKALEELLEPYGIHKKARNIVIFNDFSNIKDIRYNANIFNLSEFLEIFDDIVKESISSNLIEDIANILRLYSDRSNEMKALHNMILSLHKCKQKNEDIEDWFYESYTVLNSVENQSKIYRKGLNLLLNLYNNKFKK